MPKTIISYHQNPRSIKERALFGREILYSNIQSAFEIGDITEGELVLMKTVLQNINEDQVLFLLHKDNTFSNEKFTELNEDKVVYEAHLLFRNLWKFLHNRWDLDFLYEVYEEVSSNNECIKYKFIGEPFILNKTEEQF